MSGESLDGTSRWLVHLLSVMFTLKADPFMEEDQFHVAVGSEFIQVSLFWMVRFRKLLPFEAKKDSSLIVV